MEINEVIRRISRYQANVENLQLEKTRLLNEIDDLDNSRIYIRNQRGKAEERFATRVAKVRSLESYKSRGIRGISGKLGTINSLNASSSYVFQAMVMIETMIQAFLNANPNLY